MTDLQPKLDKQITDEPFGQQGVRAHLSHIVAGLLGVAAICCALLWYRSLERSDHLIMRSGERNLFIDSTWGRVRIYTEPVPPDLRGMRTSWSMGGGEIDPTRIRDGWAPSVWKYLGMELRFEPINPTRHATGWWIRIKWPVIVIALLIFPMLKVVSSLWRRGDSDE